MKLETQDEKGSSSSQGIALSYDAAESIEGLMEIHFNMSSSSKVSNITDLYSTNSMDSEKR